MTTEESENATGGNVCECGRRRDDPRHSGDENYADRHPFTPRDGSKATG